MTGFIFLLILAVIIYVTRNEGKQNYRPEMDPRETFAESNYFNYIPGDSLAEEPIIRGEYRGYPVTIFFIRKGIGQPRTLIELSGTGQIKLNDAKKLTTLEAINLFVPTNLPYTLRGQIYADNNRQKIYYEQFDVEKDEVYLQFVLDLLVDLTNAYGALIPLGGEIIPLLQKYAENTLSGLKIITSQLLKDIGQETTDRLAHRILYLWCPYCLVRYTAHQVTLSLGHTITYYGCRTCHQSQKFLEWKDEVIVILDKEMTTEQLQKNGVIQVNWFQFRKPFDFDEVKIIQAADEDVERFAMQIGNDTDRLRQSHYKKMQCMISRDCRLSINTMRILQRMFGEVAVE